MADLIIKSSPSNNLVIQGGDNSPAITVGNTGTTTFAENATLSGTANNIGTVTAGTLGSGVVFPAGMMRFVTEVYTNTANTASEQVTTTGALSVTIGSKIMLRALIGYEDEESSTTAYFSWYLTGDTNSGVGAGTSGEIIGSAQEYKKTMNERGTVAGSHTFITATATPTYGLYINGTNSPNVYIFHSSLTVIEIYQ